MNFLTVQLRGATSCLSSTAPCVFDSCHVFRAFLVVEFCAWFLAFSPSPLAASLSPPPAPCTQDWGLWPTGLPDFLAACMLPGTHHMDFWPLASPVQVICWIKGSFWTFKYYLCFYPMNLSPGFGLIFRTVVLKRDCSLELPRGLCRIWMPRIHSGSVKSGFLGMHRHQEF